jgi:hypothetical protein
MTSQQLMPVGMTRSWLQIVQFDPDHAAGAVLLRMASDSAFSPNGKQRKARMRTGTTHKQIA